LPGTGLPSSVLSSSAKFERWVAVFPSNLADALRGESAISGFIIGAEEALYFTILSRAVSFGRSGGNVEVDQSKFTTVDTQGNHHLLDACTSALIVPAHLSLKTA
jgi:hypothetical protein